jgi:hypothetical protein
MPLASVSINGTHVWIATENDESSATPRQVGVLNMGQEIVAAAGDLSATITACCSLLADSFSTMPPEKRPSVVKAEFGLRLSGDAKFYIVAATGECSLKVSAEWKWDHLT